MKKIKKLLAMIMAMTMMLGLGLTSFAAESTDVTVTVTNVEGASLYYDQIVAADPSSTDGWGYVTGYTDLAEDVTISELITIAAGDSNGDAMSGKLTASSNLAALLEGLKEQIQVDANKLEGSSFEATSAGLYVVIPVKEGYTYSPTLVYVPVNKTGNMSVTVKGAPDQVKKAIDAGVGESVSAGDIIKYTVTIEYPYISANYTNATFKITDTLTNGTFVIDSTHAVNVSGDVNYTVSEANETANMTIEFTNYDRAKAGTEIVITYWVKVSDTVSSSKPLQNKVASELKLTPNEDATKTEYTVISTPVKAAINKVDKEGKDLEGAVFAIFEGIATDQEEDKLISILADAVNLEGITLPNDYLEYTNLLKADGLADGNVTFDGLDAQKNYYVVEVIAPNGYKVDGMKHQLIAGGVASGYPQLDIESDDNGVTLLTTTYKFNDFKVSANSNNIVNDTLSSLPSTGGIGTTIFTIGGCAIMIAAAALYFVNRRKSEEN